MKKKSKKVTFKKSPSPPSNDTYEIKCSCCGDLMGSTSGANATRELEHYKSVQCSNCQNPKGMEPETKGWGF